jgi:hypothetical protein
MKKPARILPRHPRAEPSYSLVKALGGPREVAKIAGVHEVSVSNWSRPGWLHNGADGRIPHAHHAKLIAALKARGLAFCFDDEGRLALAAAKPSKARKAAKP